MKKNIMLFAALAALFVACAVWVDLMPKFASLVLFVELLGSFTVGYFWSKNTLMKKVQNYEDQYSECKAQLVTLTNQFNKLKAKSNTNKDTKAKKSE